jgi:hypothetical protein
MPETKTKPNIARKQRKKPLPTIAGRQFKLVAELEDEINRIRKHYRPHNEPVRGLDGALLQCYMRHHESLEDFEQYHGEMRAIEIRHNFKVPRGCGAPECVQYQIWIIFEDGYDYPFSYKISENSFGVVEDHCAASRRRLKWINKAARHLIRDQIEEHVSMHLETDGKCEISGVELNRSQAEAHHVGKSFKWLLFEFITEWCNQTNVNPNSIIVLDTDTVGGKSFEDDMCDAWLLYHARHSRIQVLSAAEHRKQHTGSVQPPWGELFV